MTLFQLFPASAMQNYLFPTLPYFLTVMWCLFAVGIAGNLLGYWKDLNLKLWYFCSFLMCASSLLIVLDTGGIDSSYFLLIYLSLILSSLKGSVWFSLTFCILSSMTVYIFSGRWLAIFTEIASLTKILLFPFFAVVSFFVNNAINKPVEDTERKQNERVEEAYAIARNQVQQKEERELQFFDRNRKLYSLLQLFQKLSVENSRQVIEDGVVYFAREEIKSQISFIAFNTDGRWETPKFLGINEIVANTISKKIQAGIFNKVIKNDEPLNYTATHYHTQGKPEVKPFDSVGIALHNILVVPVKDATGRPPFGILAVSNKLMADKYDRDDIDYLTLLGTQAGITISNMNLYKKLERSYYETILALAQSIEAKDNYTKGHVSRVEQLSVFLCKCLNADANLTDLVAKAAILHDVGKISIPDHILLKPSPLNDEEFEIMKTHTVNARDILNNITSLPAEVTNIVVHHHERYDGKGYPDHLRGAAIPLGAQIIGVTDAYDSMTTDRPYRRALSREEALKRLQEGSGTQFSPYIVDKFVDNIGKVKDIEALPHYFEDKYN